MENQVSKIEPHLDISRVLAKPRHFWQKILILFRPVYLCQKHWSLCVDDVCLIFLTNCYVVSPGSYDGTHMCGNDGNDPPKKVQELETQNRVSEENGRKLGECSHQWL